MRPRARALAAGIAGLLALSPACAWRLENLGVTDPAARGDLASFAITYVKRGDLFVARGDGTGARRLLPASLAGPGGVIFLPDLAPRGRRLLFLSGAGLDPADSTARDLALNVFEIEDLRIASWRRALLTRLLPPDATGRQRVLAVAGVDWSRDGERIALGLSRGPGENGDAVALFDAAGSPLAHIVLPGRRLGRGGSLAWLSDEALLLGLEEEAEPSGGLARLDLHDLRAPRLERLAAGRYPAVDHSGSRIAAIVEREGSWEVILMDPQGRPLRRIPRPAGRAPGRLWWAPDGRWLYFQSQAATGPLGLLNVEVLRCLDTGTGRVFDLVRLT